MDKIFTSRIFMKYIFLVLSFCLVNFLAEAQSYNYVKGTFDITIEGFNPCGSPAPNNGRLEITINAADGGSAYLIFLDGPGATDVTAETINVGSTFTFNPTSTLPDGTYNFIIRDQDNNFTINTFAEFATYPPVVLTDLTPATLTEDIRTDNTSCVAPTTGQIQSSITGGSLVLPGGGSYSYQWSSTNSLAGLPLNGTTDGSTPLNLATLLGVPGLPGGTYTLKVTDLYSVCGEVSRTFTITDPSPAIQTITTTSPVNICSGEDISITMANSEAGVNYTIFRNGVTTGNTFIGTGTGPFVMTFPSAGFADNDVIQVRGANGLCSSVPMNPANLLLRVNPIPTISGVVVGSVCAGNTSANLNYTTLTGAPNQYTIDFDLTAQGQGFVDVTNTLPATPIVIVVPASAAPGNYNAILTVRNTTTTCVSSQIPITISVIGLPSPTIAGPNDVCVNSTGNLYTTQTGKTNYLWTVSAGGTVTAGGGPTNSTVTVTWNTTGPRSVSVNYTDNTCAATAATVYPVNVKPLATPTITSGPNDVCLNSTGNVYVTQPGKTNYIWTVTGGTITAGGTTTSNTATVTWTAAGARSISINYAESGCPAATPFSYAVNVKTLPTPTVASGPNDVCVNSTGNVYTTQAGKTNYVWTVSAGGTITAGGTATDNTVTVTWNTAGPQSVSINYTEVGCTAAAPSAYAVNVKALPTPTVVSGPNDVCVNSTANVYTTQTGKANYVWTVSAGGTITAGGGPTNNTVTVTWTTAGARSVSVNYTENGCAAAAPANYPVNVKPLATPTITSGPNDVCVNSTGNVYTTQTGKTNYVWTVTGGTITAGGTTTDNTATVTWTSVGSRSISVNYAESGCPAATPVSYAVNVKALPTPTVTSGPNNVCVNSTGNVYTTQPGMTNYVWTVSGGGTITAGGGAANNTVTVTWNTTGPQSVSVNYTQNGCPAAAPTVYPVNVRPLAAPTFTGGPNDVCVNSAGNVYTTQPGMTNYVWTVSGGGTITAGGGAANNTVTVTWNTTGSQSVSVNYTQNGCPAAAPTIYPVNVKPLATPTITSGPNDVCLNSTGNVYTTQTGKTNYVWTVSGGTITAGGTPTSNTATVTWTTAGARSISVNYAESGCPAATPFSYAVNVKALPTPTVASGPNDVCVNSTGNVYTTQTGKTNYVWNVSAGGTITAGGTAADNTVTVTWTTAGARSVSVNYTENGCTSAAPSVYAVNVKALPTPTITSGPNDVCVNSTGNVYTTQPGMANYVWTVSGGGTVTAGGGAANNTVTVTWNTTGPQTVSVNYTQTGCAAAAPTVYPVNVKPLATPTITSGPNDVCLNSTGNVYTTQTGKTNYIWTVNGGTITAGGTPTSNTATVTWTTAGARSISVNYAESGCPAATPFSYAVNVKTLPTPTVASGPNDVCVNSTGNVYTTQTGKTNYVWTVSAGGTITAGGTATDNTVTVTWNTAGPQSVSINYTEVGCTAATPAAYAVNVKALPTPTVASGPNDVCVNSTGNVYTTQTGKTNYIWTVSGGGTITAGGTPTDNTVTVTWTTAGPQTVTINYTENGCVAATPGSFAVNVDTTPTIVGAAFDPVCEGATSASLRYTSATGTPNQFSIDFDGAAELAGLSDIAGATFTASPISVTIPGTISPGTYNGTLTLSNTSGCSSATLPITLVIQPTPNMTGIIVGSACAGSASTQLNYGAVVGSPDRFSVDFDDPAFTDVVNALLTPTPLNIPLLTTAAPGIYTATLVVSNSACNSTGIPITITIVGRPTPVIAGATDACQNSTDNIYSTLAGKAPYTWVVSAGGTITAGGGVNDNTVTVTWDALGAQTVSVNYVDNTCNAATPTVLDVTVNEVPTITTPSIAPVCAGATSATLTYGAVTGLADEFSIDFNAAAQSAGFIDIVNATLTASPVSFTIPNTIPAGLYSGVLTVRNAATGCVSASSPISITVSPRPTATISGTASICSGSQTPITINFTGTAPFTFQYSDGTTTFPGVSPVNSITFNVQPTVTTTYEIVSVSDASVTACLGLVIGPDAIVTVNQSPLANLPVGFTINPLCAGGISDVTVGNSQLGISYQLRNDVTNAAVGSAVPGNNGTISLPTGVLLTTTTFNVLATAPGCTPVQLTAKATINVSGAINPSLAVTAVDPTLCEGTGTIIQVANSENGVLYQLRNNANNNTIGPAVPGVTGTTIDLPTGNLSATTSFNVLATNGTCSIELTDIETVTVNINPDPGLAVTVPPGSICVGGSSVVTVTSSQTGVTYQLRTDPGNVDVGPAVPGNNGTINFPTGPLTATTSFNVLATSGVCTPVVLTDVVTVNVAGTIDATLAVTAVPATICAGTSTDIEITNSEAGVTYQLRNDADNSPVGAPVTGGGAITFPTGNLTTTTVFNVLADNGTCSIELADKETVTVDPAPDASLAVGTGLNPLCNGGSSTVTVLASQPGVSYQLRDGTTAIGPPIVSPPTGGTISLPTGPLTATTTFNVLATSGVCTPVQLTQLATITVGGTIDAGLNLAPVSPICAGSSTFIRVLASEVGVNYQLRNDATGANIGSPVPGGGTINLTTGNLAVTTMFNVVASNGVCSIELTDKETVIVTPAPDITLAVAPASGLICPGISTNIIVSNAEAGVSYQLRIGTTDVGTAVVGTGTGNVSLPTGTLTANTTFNVYATIGSCSAQLTATASVAVRPVGDPACGPGPSDCANFSAIIPTIVTQPSCNDRDAGEVSFTIARSNATASTFRVIWTYNGTDQTKFTSNTVSFDDLNSGLYQYTVIDEGNGMSCGPVDFFLDLKTQVKIEDKEVISNVTCYDGTDGNVTLKVDGTTTGEYWYKYVRDGQESIAQTFTPGAPLPGGLPADDDFIIIKVDETFAFSCPDTVMVRINHMYPRIDFAVASTEVTTCNGTDGGIQVTGITGGNTTTSALQIRLKKEVPLSTDPTGYITLEDFETVTGGAKDYADLAQGNYVVDIKDESDCIQSKPIAVQAPGQVPLAVIDIVPTDATCANEGASGSIRVTINEAGIYQVAVSQDQVNVPEDDQFIPYNSPSLPNVTFSNLIRGRYFVYIKSNTTECPTRSELVEIGGVYAVGDFDILSNCENVNLTLNNITGQESEPFVIQVFDNDDKFFQIDELKQDFIPDSKSVSFVYSPPLTHKFLTEEGTYRFVMVQDQTIGAVTCKLVSDTIVYEVREHVGIVLGQVKPSFPDPKRTGSIEIENIIGGQRFVSGTNELYYEIALSTADDDIVVFDWAPIKLSPQNKFAIVFDYLAPGIYRIEVRDASGCVKSQDVEISLDPSVFVPNIFTPNDDKVNDMFEVLNLPLGGKHKLIVSDRWGKQVFKSDDYRTETYWDAAGVTDGIYFYRLQVEAGETLTGWVEVLRGNKP